MMEIRAVRGICCAMLLVILSVMPRGAGAIDPVEMQDPQLQARYVQLAHELRCLKCQNETIADSPVGIAADLRARVRELLLQGKTDDQIRDYMVVRYGEFVLFKPRFSWQTAWLWLGPGILLMAGLVRVAYIIRQRAKLVDRDSEPVFDEPLRRVDVSPPSAESDTDQTRPA
jgi:cytochrome c-type biogenesis protein CcmH